MFRLQGIRMRLQAALYLYLYIHGGSPPYLEGRNFPLGGVVISCLLVPLAPFAGPFAFVARLKPARGFGGINADLQGEVQSRSMHRFTYTISQGVTRETPVISEASTLTLKEKCKAGSCIDLLTLFHKALHEGQMIYPHLMM